MTQIDIWSRNEVYRKVLNRLSEGKVRDCQYLDIFKGHADAFYAHCAKQFAGREAELNAPIRATAYHAPSSYSWPVCPRDCPVYQKDEHIQKSLAEGRQNTIVINKPSPIVFYVDNSRIDELKKIPNEKFDLTKLVQICIELNSAREQGMLLAIPMLVRSLLDHVPPIFGCKDFSQVANNHGPRSFKKSMSHLDNSLRNIADSYLHVQVRVRESLPNETQIDFSRDLDVLLQEIVRILK